MRLLTVLRAGPLLVLLAVGAAFGAEVHLKDGRVIEGSMAYLKDIAGDPSDQAPGASPVVFVDDELRRIFFPKGQVEEVRPGGAEVQERFHLDQQILVSGAPVATVGALSRVSKFDDFGRRIVTMRTGQGPLDIIQCITLITPKYTKVQARRKVRWTMMIATNSIPRDQLRRILYKAVNLKNINDRLRIVNFYMQAEQFEEAGKELAELLKQFPERKQEYERTLRSIRQLVARRLLREAKVRQAAGQHKLVQAMLSHFPSEGVAGETLQSVQEMLEKYKQLRAQGTGVLEKLAADMKQLAAKDAAIAPKLAPIYAEIRRELNLGTLDRMAAYQTFAADPKSTLDARVAVAISGWMQGRQGATDNLGVALSLYDVRKLVIEYFNAQILLQRDAILEKLRRQEAATAERVTRLLQQMKPPLETPAGEKEGYYELEAPGPAGGAPLKYVVQLPPEYDPYRSYPAIVTLHAPATRAASQINWWAGTYDKKGKRLGQATRNGYIVIAPEWGEPHQVQYQFSLREHLAVINPLRDACRRFSIDTDRVFLTGHSMGGVAAWDIAGAHPDLWAGVVPFVAACDKYCNHYWSNLEYVPMYIVGGQLDGDKFMQSAITLQRYMKKRFPLTVVQFTGRGHEHFSDEILNIFDWMGRYRRQWGRKEFTAKTMRPWDNFFWWAEMEGMPERAMVDPSEWPRRGAVPFPVEGKILANNNLRFKGGADKITVWLSPDMIDFKQPAKVTINNRTHNLRNEALRPDLGVLLEDVRTRADRQHPFWAKIVTGRFGDAARRGRR